jgi:ABC-type polysaccharide/polyol phosphate export permease
MRVNPLTYGMSALRWGFYFSNPAAVSNLPSLGLSLTVTMVFAAGTFFFATATAQRYVE